MCFMEQSKKKGKLAAAHRSTILSLLPSSPGEVQQELVVQGLPVAKIKRILNDEHVILIIAVKQ